MLARQQADSSEGGSQFASFSFILFIFSYFIFIFFYFSIWARRVGLGIAMGLGFQVWI